MSEKICISCKHYKQGKTCSFCANPKQTDKDKKNYCYYNFGCDLHDEGIHQTRVDYMKKRND